MWTARPNALTITIARLVTWHSTWRFCHPQLHHVQPRQVHWVLTGMLSLPSVGLLLVGAVTALFYYLVLYPLFISPLSRIPGPKLAAVSSWYLDFRYAADTAIPHLHQLIRNYGPVVRVGPNEVVVNDAQHLSTIYGVRSHFPKPHTAELFANYGVPNMFSSTSRDQHRERRRRVGKVYNMGTLLSNQALTDYIWDRIGVFQDKINSASAHAIDIYPLTTQFALDNVSFVVYGRGLDTLRGQHSEMNTYIRHNAIASVSIVRFYSWIVACSVWPLSMLLPGFITDSLASSAAFEEVNMEEVQRAYHTTKTEDTIGASTVTSLKEFGDEKEPVPLMDVASECCDHVMAGK